MNIDHSKVRSSTTPVRPARKCNTILETEIEGHIYRCERTRYKWSRFDQSFLGPMWDKEGELVFVKELKIVFEQEGLAWFPEELTSEYLLKYFTTYPHKYLELMFDRVGRVKKVIALLNGIHDDIESDVPATIVKNLEKLREAFTLFYSTMGSVFMVYDTIPYRFKEVALMFLDKRTANTYMCEFLQAEITKEAIKLGRLEEMPATSRSSTYGTGKPVIFYKEPRLMYESAMDNEVMEKLRTSGLDNEKCTEFVALRLLLPAAIQINE
ncbi:hypothetical protein HY497_00240, partial [Candidatus Woesearchaeota archaeon]|nr:hypothetical protein [Candidatus Woesearchaeota archaeon]